MRAVWLPGMLTRIFAQYGMELKETSVLALASVLVLICSANQVQCLLAESVLTIQGLHIQQQGTF